MIPADHWHDNGDGTAWLVVRECDGDHRLSVGCHKTYRDLNRPCDICGGTGAGRNRHKCPDCDGTGRHTFTVEVECLCALQPDGPYKYGPCNGTGIRTYRVSVVPGMVLPIVQAVKLAVVS